MTAPTTYNLPRYAFPMQLRAYVADGPGWKEVWQAKIDGPQMLRVPPLRKIHGSRVFLRLECGDGKVIDERPQHG